jgi:hypothetical protein
LGGNKISLRFALTLSSESAVCGRNAVEEGHFPLMCITETIVYLSKFRESPNTYTPASLKVKTKF